MKEVKDKNLQFVIDHYRDKMFETHKGLSNVKLRIGKKKKNYNIYILAGIAASIMIFFAVFFKREVLLHKTNIVASHEVIKCVLPDSTIVFLSPGSSLSYIDNDFNNEHRSVTMKGKAYFSVSKKDNIPFLVCGQHSVTKVLGTKFQINENTNDKATEIYVISGKVFFSSARESNNGVVLTKGMKANLINNELTPIVTLDLLPNPIAWTNGTFIYDETPVDVVLKELSSFYNVELQPTGIDKKITGKFKTKSLEDILEIIEESLDVKIRKKTD